MGRWEACPTLFGGVIHEYVNSSRNDENSKDRDAILSHIFGGVIHEFVNSSRNDENSWDKMPSCPTFSEEK